MSDLFKELGLLNLILGYPKITDALDKLPLKENQETTDLIRKLRTHLTNIVVPGPFGD